MKNKNYKAIVLPDVHAEYHDKAAIAAVLEFMADERFDEVVFLGDFMDLDCISFHNHGKPRLTEGKTIEGAYAIGNALLDRIEKAARRKNKKVEFTFLFGNHSDRAERLIDAQPQLKGTIEVEKGLRLSERGYKVVDSWRGGEMHRIGNLLLTHGPHGNGEHHAKQMVDRYGMSVMYGHTHTVQEFTKIRYGNQPVYGSCIGCLCELEQSYIGKRPTAWQHAFAVVEVDRDGTPFHNVIRIHDGRMTLPDGRRYGRWTTPSRNSSTSRSGARGSA